MHVAELAYPGIELAGPDETIRRPIEMLFRGIERSVSDAAIALRLYSESTDLAIAAEEDEPDLQARGARWAAEDWPRSYIDQTPNLHARSFVYALDNVSKMLGVIRKLDDTNSDLAAVLADWDSAFPGLQKVRNSAHHGEDYLLGVRKPRKGQSEIIDLQPVDVPGFTAEVGVLVNDTLIDDRISFTAADGTLRQVEVSVTSLRTATTLTQRAISSYTWRGDPRKVPR